MEIHIHTLVCLELKFFTHMFVSIISLHYKQKRMIWKLSIYLINLKNLCWKFPIDLKHKLVKESPININSGFTEASGMNSIGVRDFKWKMCNIFIKLIKHNLAGSIRMLGYLLGNVRKNIERSLISIYFFGIFVYSLNRVPLSFKFRLTCTCCCWY